MDFPHSRSSRRHLLWVSLLACGLTTAQSGCSGSSEPVASNTPTPAPAASSPAPAAPTGSDTSSDSSGAPSSAGHDSGGASSGGDVSSGGGAPAAAITRGGGPSSGGASSGGEVSSGGGFNSGGASSGGPSSGGHAGGDVSSGGGFNSGGVSSGGPSSGGHAGGGVSSGGGFNSGGVSSGGPSSGGHAGGDVSSGGGFNSGGVSSGGPSSGGGHDGVSSGGSGASPYGAGYGAAAPGAGMSTSGTMNYGSGGPYPGGGSGGANGGSQPGGNPGSLGQVGSVDPASLLSALQGFDAGTVASFPKDYGSQARMAFENGYEDLAQKLILAHLAFEPQEASGTYGQVKFSKALRRPEWHLRWGLAISMRTGDGFTGEIDPITEQMAGSSNGGSPGAPGMSSSGGSSAGSMTRGGGPGGGQGGGPAVSIGSGDDLQDIEKILGLFASVSGEMFDQRFGSGDFGDVFAGMARPVTERKENNANGNNGPGGMPQPGMSSSSGSMAPPGYPTDGSSGMMSSGMMSGGMAPGRGGPGGGAGASPLGLETLQKKHPQWRPGMVYLGQKGVQEAIRSAQDAGLDYLLFFDVRVDQRREGVENNTRARVIQVSNPEATFASSKKLSNQDVKKANKNGNADPHSMVTSALEPVFDSIDRDVKLMAMPNLSKEQAMARVGQLLASNESETRILAEIRLYQHLGLLSEDDVIAASEMLLGDDGLRLLVAAPSVQREVAEGLQKHVKSYGELGMTDPNGPAPQNNNGGYPGGYPGGGMSTPGQPGGGAPGANAPALPPLPGVGANSGGGVGGGSVAPPPISL